MSVEQFIKSKQGTIIDVRTVGEFCGGHAEGSINIPLNELPSRVDELTTMQQPLLLCCASGGRSGQAAQFLSQFGLECFNVGSWLEVNYIQTA